MLIKQKKGQTIFYAILLSGVALLFLTFVILDMRKIPHDHYVLLDNTVAYWIMKVLCVVFGFFVVAGDIYLIKQIYSKEPLIEICDEYFYDNSSAISLGKIAWSDMEQAYIKGGFLNIKLKNPEQYFKKKNWFQMLMIKGNHKLGYEDVCISWQRFQKDKEKFLDEFSKRMTIGL